MVFVKLYEFFAVSFELRRPSSGSLGLVLESLDSPHRFV